MFGTALIKCYFKNKGGEAMKLGLRKDRKTVWNAGGISPIQISHSTPSYRPYVSASHCACTCVCVCVCVCVRVCVCVCVCVKVSQLGLTLCDPMDCSPPNSSVHGILQARILEWVIIPFPGDLSNPKIESRSPTLAVLVYISYVVHLIS